MNSRSNNLLVTGGCGFIGSNFIRHYLKNHLEVNIINLDAITYAGNTKNTKEFDKYENYTFIKGNINNARTLRNIFDEFDIDGVINFAAESHVDNSINSPQIFIDSNINGVFNLLNICYEFWMNSPFDVKSRFKNARFHQISTDEVYGSIDEGSFSENSKYSPNSPYSASKASADMLVRSFNKTYGLNVTTSISSNNYGQNQHIEKFIPKIIRSLINDKKIPIYGDGNNIRDWIFVEDNCIAIDIIFNKGESGDVFNVASGYEISNLELVNRIHQIIFPGKKNNRINFINDRFGHDRRYSISTQKIHDRLNWFVKFDFEKKFENFIKNQI